MSSRKNHISSFSNSSIKFSNYSLRFPPSHSPKTKFWKKAIIVGRSMFGVWFVSKEDTLQVSKLVIHGGNSFKMYDDGTFSINK